MRVISLIDYHCETSWLKSMNDVRIWLTPTPYSLLDMCVGIPKPGPAPRMESSLLAWLPCTLHSTAYNPQTNLVENTFLGRIQSFWFGRLLHHQISCCGTMLSMNPPSPYACPIETWLVCPRYRSYGMVTQYHYTARSEPLTHNPMYEFHRFVIWSIEMNICWVSHYKHRDQHYWTR